MQNRTYLVRSQDGGGQPPIDMLIEHVSVLIAYHHYIITNTLTLGRQINNTPQQMCHHHE